MSGDVNEDHLDLIFKALADPTRRRIVDCLYKRPEQSLFEVCVLSVSEDGRSLSRQTISQHLDTLEKAGLIRTSWRGRTKKHSLNVEPMRVATELWLMKYL